MRKGCGARAQQGVAVVPAAEPGGSCLDVVALSVGRLGPFQAAVGAIWCLWSFRRLWVAVVSRHSERAEDLPRRWKRSIRRLNFVLAKTGSIMALRFR